MSKEWRKIMDKDDYEVYSKNNMLKYKCKHCEYFIIVSTVKDGIVFITAHLKKFHNIESP